MTSPCYFIAGRFLFVTFFVLLSVGSPWLHANERVIDYSLEVSFNTQASKINGSATIPIKEGEAINLEKGRWNILYVAQTEETSRGVKEGFLKPPVAVEISTLKTFADVMERVAGKQIIYVGENHNQFSHHVLELEVIKDLHRRGKKIAIGMEMFQRPFQRTLDDYIEERIDERELLKRTQYFKRWGFDYNLYRSILQFARSEKIPVVALNMSQEIVDKVFKGGLDSLSEEDKKWVPPRMDFSDDAYKERLQKVFQEHEGFGAENFNFFFQAQILWDETMSESVDEFLKAQPTDQMVVLAGNGHLAYGSGIPREQRGEMDTPMQLS